MLERDSLLECVGVFAWVGVVGPLIGGVSVPVTAAAAAAAAGRLDPDVSANRLDLSAASQSKGECTEAALNGDLGE